MKNLRFTTIAAGFSLAATISACGGGAVINKESSTSAIRVAEESGASTVPNASLYLQFAREGLESAKKLAADGEKEQAESMLLRAQVDAELAAALSRSDTDQKEATEAIDRVRKLRQDNQLPTRGN